MITSSKASPFCAGVLLAAFWAMLARAFSRRESRYSCDTSSSSSELSALDSDSDSEDVDEPEDVDDLEENSEVSSRSSESAGCNLPFPFCDTGSAIAAGSAETQDLNFAPPARLCPSLLGPRVNCPIYAARLHWTIYRWQCKLPPEDSGRRWRTHELTPALSFTFAVRTPTATRLPTPIRLLPVPEAQPTSAFALSQKSQKRISCGACSTRSRLAMIS